MTSVQGRGRPCRERSSAAPSVAPPDSFPPPESGNKLSDQPAGLSTKPPVANAPAAANSIPKYSENDLQRIFKTVLEARVPASTPVLAPAPVPTPAPAPTLAPIIAEAPREKLKTRSPDLYRRKSHMDYYNFCQQCEDYFATAGATGPTRILFAASFLRYRISFYWQQYKWRHDADTPVPVTWNAFKAFLRRSLDDSQAFVDAYWGKIKRDSQHQLEEVLNWAAHLEHLQAVLREFDPAATPNEETMIRYFREGLRPSVQAQLDTRGRNQDSWEEAVEKAINAQAKMLLQSSSSIRNMDSRCLSEDGMRWRAVA